MSTLQERTGARRPHGFAYQAHFRVLDYAFRLDTDDEYAAQTVNEILAPFRGVETRDEVALSLVDDHETWAPYALYLGNEPLREHSELAPVLDYMFWYVNHQAIINTKGHLMVHAAAASLRGLGVMLPASMDSGKSTLVAGLVCSGFDYLTDEVALVDQSSGILHPYPKALWLEEPSINAIGRPARVEKRLLGEQYQVPANDLRPHAIGASVPVRLIVTPRYDEGAQTQLEAISRAEAIVMLRRNCFNFPDFGDRGLDLLLRLVEGVPCYRLTVGDLNGAVETLTRLVGGLGGPQSPLPNLPYGD